MNSGRDGGTETLEERLMWEFEGGRGKHKSNT